MMMATDMDAFPASQEAAFTAEEENELKARLFALLSRQVRLRTQGDHSSLREEDAAELLDSLLFTLRYALFLRGLPMHALLTDDLPEMLVAGQEALQVCVEETEALYQKARADVAQFGSRALGDTILGIGQFFRCYDLRLYAHRIPASIDYQLCAPLGEHLRGVLYIRAYLEQLLTENELIGRFTFDPVYSLLRRVSPDYRELLINLYEPVAANAVGLALQGCDTASLQITCAQAAQIHARLAALPPAAARKRLAETADAVCRTLRICDERSCGSLRKAAVELYPRIALSPQSAAGVFYACP